MLASAEAFSISIPDKYEQVSENEWYTDSFYINDVASEVSITVSFDAAAVSYEEAFSDGMLARVQELLRNTEGFNRFISKPKTESTDKYKYIVSSYLFEADGAERGAVIYFFYSENKCCTVYFDASNPMFIASLASTNIINTITFREEFYADVTILPEATETSSEDEEVNQSPQKHPDTIVVGIILAIVMPVVIGLVAFWTGEAIYWCFDHGKWSKNAQPDMKGKIISVSSREKSLGKNDTKYITTVMFSDGYVFKTSKTKRKDKLFSYKITIDGELRALIIQNAIKSHGKAVKKRMKSNMITADETPVDVTGVSDEFKFTAAESNSALKCKFCGQIITPEEITHVSNGRLQCDACYQKDLKTADSRSFPSKTGVSDEFKFTAATSNSALRCKFCGQIITPEEITHVSNGRLQCDACYQKDLKTADSRSFPSKTGVSDEFKFTAATSNSALRCKFCGRIITPEEITHVSNGRLQCDACHQKDLKTVDISKSKESKKLKHSDVVPIPIPEDFERNIKLNTKCKFCGRIITPEEITHVSNGRLQCDTCYRKNIKAANSRSFPCKKDDPMGKQMYFDYGCSTYNMKIDDVLEKFASFGVSIETQDKWTEEYMLACWDRVVKENSLSDFRILCQMTQTHSANRNLWIKRLAEYYFASEEKESITVSFGGLIGWILRIHRILPRIDLPFILKTANVIIEYYSHSQTDDQRIVRTVNALKKASRDIYRK